ncbi:MAG TPA: TlpA disulfide reductase family protein [Bacteroidia bacterium]|nr:TlpA disulfide reductase family protein [Bacteroidia bacterium]
MKKYNLSIVIIFLLKGIVYAQATDGNTAREVLENMNKKCLQIQNGKFTAEYKLKSYSELDTNLRLGVVIFERLPDDSLFGFKLWSYCTNEGIARYYDGKNVYIVFDKDKSVLIDTLRKKRSMIYNSRVGPFAEFPLVSRNLMYALQNDETTIAFDSLSGKDTVVIRLKYNIETDNWERWFIDVKSGYPVAREAYYKNDIDEIQYDYFKLTSLSLNNDNHGKWLNSQKWPIEYDTFYQQPKAKVLPLPDDTLAPAWEGLSLNGDSIRFPGLGASLYLIDFWYKACHPCQQAVPFLQRMHENYSAKGLKVIGLNPYDYKIKDSELFQAFLKRKNVSYALAFVNSEVPQKYHVQGYPLFYLINKNGNIIHSQSGYGPDVDGEFEKIIKEYLEKN